MKFTILEKIGRLTTTARTVSEGRMLQEIVVDFIEKGYRVTWEDLRGV